MDYNGMVEEWVENGMESPPWLRINSYYRTKPSEAEQSQKEKCELGAVKAAQLSSTAMPQPPWAMINTTGSLWWWLSPVLFVSFRCFVICSS